MNLQVTFELSNGITVNVSGTEANIRLVTAPYIITHEIALPPEETPGLRATFTLPTGTWVAIEGRRADIIALLDHYAKYASSPLNLPSEVTMSDEPKPTPPSDKPHKKAVIPPRKPIGAAPAEQDDSFEGPSAYKSAGEEVDPQWIAEKAQTCAEAGVLFPKIFNTNNQTDRVLAVLYVLHKYVNPVSTLTAREISDVLEEIGAPMQPTNVSKVFRTEARSFVSKDSTGRAARFRLNNQGISAVERMLAHNRLL